jgi:hypothetical protein
VEALGGTELAKMTRHGVIHDVSTYPLPTFRPRHADRASKALTFDINFELYDDNGERFRVWFYRGFRLPPPLKDGDRVEITGRFGQMFGLVSKDIFFASRIVDRKRGRIYTGFRNKRISSEDQPFPTGEAA